ncbi:MAG: hypothetical protein JXR20_06485 [Balneola sp.]
MNGLKVEKICVLLLLLSVFVFVPNKKIIAQSFQQQQIVDLELDVSDNLANSQYIGFVNLLSDNEGTGPVLFSGFMQNLTPQKVTDLFLEINISAGKIGRIANIKSHPNYPFSLDPMQSVYVTNNTRTDNHIPGIEEDLEFDGGLTPEGDNFIENLNGSTTLPADIYTIEIIIFQNTNAHGRVNLASAQAEIGGGVAFSEAVDFFLRTPGDVIGSNVEITNPYPQFSWEGEPGVEYRLIVVRNNGNDSPESLLQSALSSAPISEGGSLLQYENLDVYVTGETFQYPSSGAQPLEMGQTYYWQLSTTLQSINSVEERTSEIWSFKLSEPETADAPIILTEETEKALQNLVGNGVLENLISAGYAVESFEIDGVTYSGNQASIILAELLRKIESGDIVLSGDN